MSSAHTSQPPAGLSTAVLLDAYADGALSPEAAAWVEARLAERPDWREHLDRARVLMAALRTQLPPAPPALSDARLDDLLEAARVNARSERRNLWLSPYLLVPAALLLFSIGIAAFSTPLGSAFPARGGENAATAKEMGGTAAFMTFGGGAGPFTAAPVGGSADTFSTGDDLSNADAGRPLNRLDLTKVPASVSMKIEKRAKTGDSPYLDGLAEDKARNGDRRDQFEGCAGRAVEPASPTPAASPAPAQPLAASPAADAARLAGGRGRTSAAPPASAGKPASDGKPDSAADGVAPSKPAAPRPSGVTKGRREAVDERHERSSAEREPGGTGTIEFEAIANGAIVGPPRQEMDGEFQAERDSPEQLQGRITVKKKGDQNKDQAAGEKKTMLDAREGGRRVRSVASTGTAQPAPAPAFQRIADIATSNEETTATRWEFSKQAERVDAPARSPGPVTEPDTTEQRLMPMDAVVGGESAQKHPLAADYKAIIPGGDRAPLQRSPAAIANLLSAATSGERHADLGALLLAIDPAVVHPFATATVPASASAVVPRGRVLVATALAAGGQVRLEAGRIVVGEPRPFDPLDTGGLDAEQFRAAFATAPFLDTARDHRHTVAITADTASFDRARNDLAKHRPVDPLGIQVEHFVNAVPFAWPVAAPGAAEAFTLSAEGGAVALGQSAEASAPAADRMLVAVGLQANPALPEQRRSLRLTVAVDASGSMARPGGIERVRAGLRELQRQLKSDDRLAIVAFADRARVVLPPTVASDGERIRSALDGITPQGATNAADGLALAYQLASETATGEAVSRVVLATDGATLVGDLDRTVLQVEGWRARRIPLLIVGCGEERYEAAALDRLAQAGAGEHLFLGSDSEAIEIFRTRLLPERLSVLGRDAKLQVVWNPLRVAYARLVGFDTRRLRHQDFRDDSVQAGALAEASRVTALFEIRLATGAASGPLGAAHVRYHDTRRDAVRELICPLPGSLIASTASPRLRIAACAAQLGDILGATWWANAGTLRAAPLVSELERIGRDPAVAGELGRFVRELRMMAEAAARAERRP